MLSGSDNVVDNKCAQKAFDLAQIEDKDIITYDELDHMLLTDKEYLSLIQKDFISWFNTHC